MMTARGRSMMDHWDWTELQDMLEQADDGDRAEVSAQEFFDQQAWDRVGMSGDEFRRRLDSGEWDDLIEDPEFCDYRYLARLADSLW